MSKSSIAAQIAAFAGAVAVIASQQGAAAEGLERCYGITVAGQNDCASVFLHSCAGESTEDYNGADWVIVPMGSCVTPGSTSAFEGHGGPIDEEATDTSEDRDHG